MKQKHFHWPWVIIFDLFSLLTIVTSRTAKFILAGWAHHGNLEKMFFLWSRIDLSIWNLDQMTSKHLSLREFKKKSITYSMSCTFLSNSNTFDDYFAKKKPKMQIVSFIGKIKRDLFRKFQLKSKIYIFV